MAEGGVKIRITGDDSGYEKTLKGLEGKTSKILGGVGKGRRHRGQGHRRGLRRGRRRGRPQAPGSAPSAGESVPWLANGLGKCYNAIGMLMLW